MARIPRALLFAVLLLGCDSPKKETESAKSDDDEKPAKKLSKKAEVTDDEEAPVDSSVCKSLKKTCDDCVANNTGDVKSTMKKTCDDFFAGAVSADGCKAMNKALSGNPWCSAEKPASAPAPQPKTAPVKSAPPAAPSSNGCLAGFTKKEWGCVKECKTAADCPAGWSCWKTGVCNHY